MVGVVTLCKFVAKGRKVCLCDVAHVLDKVGVMVVQELVAKGVDLPRKCSNDVGIEVLQGQL